jgi:hypothetical protein
MLERGAHASVFQITSSFRVGDDGETASPVTRFRMNRSSLGNPATVTELTEARVPVARSGRERVRGWGGATCRVQHRRRYLVARADRARWPARSSKPVGGVTSLAGGFDSHAPSPASPGGSARDTDLWGKSGVHRCGTPEDRTPPASRDSTSDMVHNTGSTGEPASHWSSLDTDPTSAGTPRFHAVNVPPQPRPASYRPPSRESTVRARKSRWLSQRRQVGRERMIKSRHRQAGCARYRPRRYSRSVEFGGG